MTPGRLHLELAQSDARRLPFPDGVFHLVTVSNLLFLLADPGPVLAEIARLVSPTGQVCVLNPSERMSARATAEQAAARGLQGAAYASFVRWGQRADASLRLVETMLAVGTGLARFERAVASS